MQPFKKARDELEARKVMIQREIELRRKEDERLRREKEKAKTEERKSKQNESLWRLKRLWR